MPDRRPARLPAPVPRRPSCTRPVTGYYSLIYGNDGHRATPRTTCSPAPTRGCSSAGSPTCSPAATRPAATSSSPSTRPCSRPRWPASRASPAPSSRSTRRPARSWAWPARRRYDPNQLSSHDPDAIRAYREQLEPTTRPATNQAISQRYPPGSIFKVIVSAAALATGDYTPDTRDPRARRAHAARHQHRRWRTSTASSCNGGARAAADRRADHLLQHRLRPARHRPRRGQASGTWPRRSASTTRASTCRCRSRRSTLGDIENDAALGPDLDRPAATSSMTPLQARDDRRRRRQRRHA